MKILAALLGLTSCAVLVGAERNDNKQMRAGPCDRAFNVALCSRKEVGTRVFDLPAINQAASKSLEEL